MRNGGLWGRRKEENKHARQVELKRRLDYTLNMVQITIVNIKREIAQQS